MEISQNPGTQRKEPEIKMLAYFMVVGELRPEGEKSEGCIFVMQE